eukprot:CAMPEP_0170782864 /NCGR_PEP_ID=MMETSP0733-20121128/15157_1 /TAXON_ID=186038 /ORGANISM="Fragilariopsis kerguelensis, Strain L26-C5" /LENGTH=75 /DNA_ID=CAMNT_0011127393 /DNA_START=51 /DNA_END=275 /DNA_ORIENTATION=-
MTPSYKTINSINQLYVETATAAVPSEREDKDLVVLLPFVWFPLDDTLFIAPDMNNTDNNIITNSRYTVIRVPIHS